MRIKPAELPRPEEKPVPVPFVLKCIACRETAEVIFQGSTFCTKCIQESIRVGTV